MVYPGAKERKQAPVVEANVDSILSNKPPGSSKDDVVTLTKSQLRAILEAIGQVGSVNINARSEKQAGDEHVPKREASVPVCCGNQVSELSCSYAVSLPTSEELPCPLNSVLPDASKEWSSSSQKPQPSSPSKLPAYSRLDQKRVQWEKEKAEMLDWNPWGKPGAGAPTRRTLPVASVAPRTENQLLTVQTNTVPYSSSMPNGGGSSCLTSPSHFRSGGVTLTERSYPDPPSNNNKALTAYNYQLVKPVPPVFKSSINFGSVEDDSLYHDGVKKQQWLKDLEIQREEQRLRRAAATESYNQTQENEWLNGNVEDIDSISVYVEGSSVPHPTDGRTHVRGQGFKLDPVSAARAEERRLKAQEYQQAIRLQMEEKQQRMQIEKERKKREEEEEESRLINERARLQAEYELEQRRLKQKKEVEEQKQTAVLSAVRKAEAEAEAERKTKKSNKLNSATVSNSEPISPRKSPREPASPQTQPRGAKQKEEKRDVEVSKTTQQTATVRPLQNSRNDSHQDAKEEQLLQKELGIQTVQSSNQTIEDSSGYIVNRVLTPSLFRMKIRRDCAKDFGTQTDVNYGRWIGDDPETTDQSNTSSICAPIGKRLNRIQHSKPYKASRRQFGSDIDSMTDRPKWGANQPSKSFIRMTDRDPHFTKRKKMQELRKQHWEREMASQQAMRLARRSSSTYQNQSKSYPNLRIRRTRCSSDGTAGFSSSEFETSHAQSNSPPRRRQNYGFRSVCGSAEDVTCYGPSSTYSSTLLPSVPRRRASQSSDNLPSIIGGSEPAPSRFTDRFSFPEVSSASGTAVQMRRKWHSQDTFYPRVPDRQRLCSPPVPALQRQLICDAKSSCLSSPLTHSRRKWSDQESFDLESVALSHAKSRPPTSEEGSDQIDRDSLSSADSSKKPKTPTGHNPLVCPEVITGRPTPRQDRILQNLSSLRHGLLQKQKELENLIRHPPHKSS